MPRNFRDGTLGLPSPPKGYAAGCQIGHPQAPRQGCTTKQALTGLISWCASLRSPHISISQWAAIAIAPGNLTTRVAWRHHLVLTVVDWGLIDEVQGHYQEPHLAPRETHVHTDWDGPRNIYPPSSTSIV